MLYCFMLARAIDNPPLALGRRLVLIPLLQVLVGITSFFSAMVAADRLYHYYVAFYWRGRPSRRIPVCALLAPSSSKFGETRVRRRYISRTKPEDRFPHTPLPEDVARPTLHAPDDERTTHKGRSL